MGTQFYNEPQPVNLGTGYEISIRNLITLICELMDFDGEIIWETDKPNGQPRRCLDTQRAKQAFGFVTQIDFKQGLKNTIDWYRQHAA
jgi:GDP-L-fucose synthase